MTERPSEERDPVVASSPTDGDDAVELGSDDEAHGEDNEPVQVPPPRRASTRVAMVAGVGMVVAISGLAGWLGFRAYQSHQAEQQRQLFVSVGRQGAVNLTTIDYHHADADVQRILDSATGRFYDDFNQRAQPFLDVVKQAQSVSVGTVTEAGLESVSGNNAQVIVAVSVNTTNAGSAAQQPRSWRMRIDLERSGNEAKVSNVEFVP